MALKQRDVWIDSVKVLSCIFVVLGHFFQSMVKSGVLPQNDLYLWFDQTIYYFHVPLFFLCSGYLYQKYSVVNTFSSWRRNVYKKAISLGIPYAIFSIATWLLKTVFSSSVNDPIGGLAETLLIAPVSPYWFLYTLFFIFLVTPTFSSTKISMFGMGTAFSLKLLTILGYNTRIFAVSTFLNYEIWFVLGMVVAVSHWDAKLSKRIGVVVGTALGILFIFASVWIYNGKVYFPGEAFLMGMLACVAVLLVNISFFSDRAQIPFCGFSAHYTMPVFLMHTLFAASTRTLLFRLEIYDATVHILLGLGISFLGPIVVAEISKHFSWIEFFLYPTKYIKVKNKE